MFNGEQIYLKPNVMMEPLVDQWYAWAHWVSPATFAMNLVERHLKIMESYARAPMVHAAAVKNPAMLGGPFIDLGGKRVPEIKQLISKTRQQRSLPIEFQKGIIELDEVLRNEASGFSLEPLYKKIPSVLKGYVELVYDLNNHPSFRFIEPLLYRSDHYDPSMQSILLSLIVRDDRPFILSTPRLIGEGELHLEIPFADPRIDELFEMRRIPQTFSAIKDKLGFEDHLDEQFARLFTAQAAPVYPKYEGKGARWRYFGHACILVETESTSILLDPVLSYSYESEISRYTYADLPDEIDYALITHNHQDHILFETILQLRRRIKNVVVPRNGHGALQDPSLKLMMEALGFKNVIEMNEMDEIRTERGRIIGLPFLGEHADLNIRTKLAYWVEVDNQVLLFAADSCNIEPEVYRHLNKLLGDIDALFLGMECDGAPLSWLYGPLLTKPLERNKDQARRLAGSNYQRGIEIVNSFSPKEAYVYAMGQEPWLNYIMSKKYTEESNPIIASNQLIEDCRQRGILAERLFGEKEILLS
ncbi:MAG: MBL fold metallo-hydrolase [Acidobacteriota bacterium]